MAVATDSKQEIGNRIRGIRKDRKLSLQKLSNETGISVGYLSDVERGENALSGEKIATIARVLATTTDYLLSGETDSKASSSIEINIPTALSEAAMTLNLSYEQTIRLLEGRRSLVAKRTRGDGQEWNEEQWIEFYRTVEEYL